MIMDSPIQQPLEVTSSSSESLTYEQRSARVEKAIYVVQGLSELMGDTLPVIPITEVNELTLSREGVYVINMEGSKTDISGASFTFVPENLSGAADSAHAAIPGKLDVGRRDGETSSFSVVAKCFSKRSAEERFKRVKREVITMEDMIRRGALTIKPLAVVIAEVDDEPQIVLLTYQYDGLKTLDNLPWGRGLTEENISNAVISFQALGGFNVTGRKHGDAKIKNAAQDEFGAIGMIDYETTEQVDITNPQVVGDVVHSDFGKLIDSLIKKGFFGDNKDKQYPAAQIRDVLETLILAYVGQWVLAGDKVKNAIWEAMYSAVDSAMPGLRDYQGYYRF